MRPVHEGERLLHRQWQYTLARLSGAHFLVDHYSSMLGALLPILIPSLGLSMAGAGLLGGALIFSGSLMQPLYGYLADHSERKMFVILGPAISGVFISSLGLATGFPSAFFLVLMGGIGVAAFHPQAAAIVASARRDAPGVQLSVFITAGMLGFSLGPLLITSLVSLVGISRSYLAAIPGLVFSGILYRYESSFRSVRRRVGSLAAVRQCRQQWRSLALLFVLVVFRSAIKFVFASFLGVYLTGRGYSAYEAGQVLTVFLFVGASSGFLGGMLSDRIGGKRVILASMSLSLPLFLAFLATEGVVSLLFCVAGAGTLILTVPVNVAMAQRLFPEGSGMVSALMMGFGWGIGGIALPLVGLLSDSVGLHAALSGLVWLCLPGLILGFALPSPGREIRGQGGPDRVQLQVGPTVIS